MKIAIAGKGGTGKTTVTTLLATYLGKKNGVLALDTDSNENLGQALGIDPKKLHSMKKIRHFIDEIYTYTKTDPNWETRHLMPHSDASYYHFSIPLRDSFIKKITIQKDNIFVGHVGTVDEEKRGIQSMCGAFGLMRVFLNHLQEEKDSFVLVDLPAGNELLTRAAVMNMDEVLLVVEPTLKNLTVAKDILLSLNKLLFDHTYVLVNKSFQESDIAYVSEQLQIPKTHMRRIPFSQELLAMDNMGKLSFDTVSHEIQQPIIEIIFFLKGQTASDNNLFKRASMLDKKLFPNEKSVLSEEIHV